MKFIDDLLNRITMYRLVFYYLIALIGVAAVFGAFGILPYSPIAILLSLFLFIGACWIFNTLFAKIFRVPANAESVYITAFILTLIISPISLSLSGSPLSPGFGSGLIFLLVASLFAMASKYILAIHRKHLFNPAAIAVALTGFTLGQYASWWVGGNLPLLGFVVVGGLLVVRKIKRFDLVIAFFVAALASIIFTHTGFDPLTTAEKALVHTSLFFFAFVMLTEPLTTPPTRPLRIAYGALVGAFFSPAIHLGSFYSTPELALVVGNLFSFAVSPKRKYKLTLASKTEISANTYDFAFTPDAKQALNFRPGQYMEFTLPGDGADLRGNRRYFTIASSPTEPHLHLGVKFYGDPRTGQGSSTFKRKLLALKPGDTIMGGQLAGDFTLPRDSTGDGVPSQKLAFVAGGIGITPFRSMVKYLTDRARNEQSAHAASSSQPDIILLYSNRTEAEISYRDIFDEAARAVGLKVLYVTTDMSGRIDAKFVAREVADWRDRTFYLSGPRGLVVSFEQALRDLGVPRARVKTDFFPGFA